MTYSRMTHTCLGLHDMKRSNPVFQLEDLHGRNTGGDFEVGLHSDLLFWGFHGLALHGTNPGQDLVRAHAAFFKQGCGGRNADLGVRCASSRAANISTKVRSGVHADATARGSGSGVIVMASFLDFEKEGRSGRHARAAR